MSAEQKRSKVEWTGPQLTSQVNFLSWLNRYNPNGYETLSTTDPQISVTKRIVSMKKRIETVLSKPDGLVEEFNEATHKEQPVSWMDLGTIWANEAYISDVINNLIPNQIQATTQEALNMTAQLTPTVSLKVIPIPEKKPIIYKLHLEKIDYDAFLKKDLKSILNDLKTLVHSDKLYFSDTSWASLYSLITEFLRGDNELLTPDEFVSTFQRINSDPECQEFIDNHNVVFDKEEVENFSRYALLKLVFDRNRFKMDEVPTEPDNISMSKLKYLLKIFGYEAPQEIAIVEETDFLKRLKNFAKHTKLEEFEHNGGTRPKLDGAEDHMYYALTFISGTYLVKGDDDRGERIEIIKNALDNYEDEAGWQNYMKMVARFLTTAMKLNWAEDVKYAYAKILQLILLHHNKDGFINALKQAHKDRNLFLDTQTTLQVAPV